MGSRGDVQPYVALGMGLQAAGHQVRLATSSEFETFIRSRGLDHFPTGSAPRSSAKIEMKGLLGRRWESYWNPFYFLHAVLNAKGVRAAMHKLLNDYMEACRGTDLILYRPLVDAGADSIAEKLGIQTCGAWLQHLHSTGAYPEFWAKPRPRLGKPYNRLTYTLFRHFSWHVMRQAVNQWRTQNLNLDPYPFMGPFRKWKKQDMPVLYGFSPSVVPIPPEWKEDVQVTGYWFLKKTEGWQPSSELINFLDSGPPPVCITFGSVVDTHPNELIEVVLQALALSRHRGLLVTKMNGLKNKDLPDEVLKVDSVPFDWLFPRMAALVHHGGAGTTASGLQAGIPTIIVPFFLEHFFWARRVSQLGVGPQSIPRKKLSATRLADAISKAASDPGIRKKAAALGRCIQAEDGVARAVDFINQHFFSHK